MAQAQSEKGKSSLLIDSRDAFLRQVKLKQLGRGRLLDQCEASVLALNEWLRVQGCIRDILDSLSNQCLMDLALFKGIMNVGDIIDLVALEKTVWSDMEERLLKL